MGFIFAQREIVAKTSISWKTRILPKRENLNVNSNFLIKCKMLTITRSMVVSTSVLWRRSILRGTCFAFDSWYIANPKSKLIQHHCIYKKLNYNIRLFFFLEYLIGLITLKWQNSISLSCSHICQCASINKSE